MKAILSHFAGKREVHSNTRASNAASCGPFKRTMLAAVAALLVLSANAVICTQQPDFAPAAQNQAIDAEAFRIKAFSQFDLAMLYLKNGEVDKAVVEARQILQSRIPLQYEDAVAESTSKIAEELGLLHRFEPAQALLDEAFKVLSQIPSHVKVLRDKSRLYYGAGDTAKAIECWKRADELEGKRLH